MPKRTQPLGEFFPLPALAPVSLSEFRPEFAAQVEWACRLPDGTIWVQDRDGVLGEFRGEPRNLVATLLDLADHRDHRRDADSK